MPRTPMPRDQLLAQGERLITFLSAPALPELPESEATPFDDEEIPF